MKEFGIYVKFLEEEKEVLEVRETIDKVGVWEGEIMRREE